MQVTADHMDIGIKLKGAKTTNRFQAAGTWNSMVTHRVRIDNPRQIDAEVLRSHHQVNEEEDLQVLAPALA